MTLRALRPLWLSLGGALIAMGVACASSEEKPAEDAASATKAEDPAVAMGKHYDSLVKLMDAVVAGKLEDTKLPAAAIADREIPASLPPEWQAQLKTVQDEAGALAGAETIEQAADGVGKIAASCGACHAKTLGGPLVLFPDDAPNEGDIPSHMQRHNWAAHRLLEGLVGPDEEAWTIGIEMLKEDPLGSHPEKEGETPEAASGDVMDIAHQVHEIAPRGSTTATTEGRGEIVGDLLKTCAKCHQALNIVPQ